MNYNYINYILINQLDFFKSKDFYDGSVYAEKKNDEFPIVFSKKDVSHDLTKESGMRTHLE